MKYEKQMITCPLCGRKVGTHDGRGTMVLQYRCKKCNKLIVYNPIGKTTKAIRIPHRQESSGMRFW